MGLASIARSIRNDVYAFRFDKRLDENEKNARIDTSPIESNIQSLSLCGYLLLKYGKSSMEIEKKGSIALHHLRN